MKDDFLIPIGHRIADIRRSNGLTQEALAEVLGVTPKHISHVECGSSSLSWKFLAKFCSLYNVSLDYLVFGKPDNEVLNKLPKKIVEILYTGTANELELLNRYLELYIELSEKQD